MQNKNNNISSISVKPVEPRYIFLKEDIYDALNIFESNVYLALRYAADYRQESSTVEMTIEDLMVKSKVKRRMLFHCLKTLEEKYFLIQRLNWDKGTFGKTNEYQVAQTLNYFKPHEIHESEAVESSQTCDKCKSNIFSNEYINGSNIEGVHEVHTVVHQVHTVPTPVHQVHTVDDLKSKPEKSTYKETYYPQTTETKSTLSIKEMLQTNPLNLPEQMIEDWVINRKAKKSPVTVTAWIRLNKQLSQCKNPIEAFEECVGAGWISFKSEWVDKPKEKKSHFDNDSIEWAKGIEEDIF